MEVFGGISIPAVIQGFLLQVRAANFLSLRWPSGHLSGSGRVGGSAKGLFRGSFARLGDLHVEPGEVLGKHSQVLLAQFRCHRKIWWTIFLGISRA